MEVLPAYLFLTDYYASLLHALHAVILISIHISFQVTVQALDEKLGRMVTRVVLPRVVMHSRHHYGVSYN